MVNFLGPYFVQNNYHSAYAPHSQLLPTKAWNPGIGVGTFDTWAGTPIAADTMIEGLIDMMLAFMPSTNQYDNSTIFKQLLPADKPQPLLTIGWTGKIGTDATAGWYPAVEEIFIARTSLFGIAKISLMDADSQNNFAPRLAFTGADAGLFGEWGADVNGWCGRDNGQVVTPMKITTNLNQKLRKEYRLD